MLGLREAGIGARPSRNWIDAGTLPAVPHRAGACASTARRGLGTPRFRWITGSSPPGEVAFPRMPPHPNRLIMELAAVRSTARGWCNEYACTGESVGESRQEPTGRPGILRSWSGNRARGDPGRALGCVRTREFAARHWIAGRTSWRPSPCLPQMFRPVASLRRLLPVLRCALYREADWQKGEDGRGTGPGDRQPSGSS